MPRKPDPRYLAIDGFKLCRTCEKVKPVSEFYKDKQSVDGYTRTCRECQCELARSWYQDNREHKLTRDKERSIEKAHKEGRAPGVRRKNPEKYPATDGMKRCTACDRVLPVAEFSPKGKSRPGLRPECRDCTKKRTRAGYEKSRGRHLAHSRKQWESMDEETRARYAEGHRKRRRNDPEWRKQQDLARTYRRYGLTPDDYDRLLAAQGGVCAICGGPPVGQGNRYHVDHDHETGVTRGLLCTRCNTALGLLGDDPDRMSAAIEYLRNPPVRLIDGQAA